MKQKSGLGLYHMGATNGVAGVCAMQLGGTNGMAEVWRLRRGPTSVVAQVLAIQMGATNGMGSLTYNFALTLVWLGYVLYYVVLQMCWIP